MKPPDFRRQRPAHPDALLVEENVSRWADGVRALLGRGLTYADNFRGEVATVAFTVPDEWTPLSLTPYGLSVWFASTPDRVPAARKVQGSIHLRGTARHRAANIVGWVQPVAKCPPGLEGMGICAADYLYGWAALDTNASGDVWLAAAANAGTASGHLSFDGVTFQAASPAPVPWPEASRPVVTLGQDFPAKPGAVYVLSAMQENDGPRVEGVRLHWEPVRSGKFWTVRIRNTDGLTTGVRYILSLLVVPE